MAHREEDIRIDSSSPGALQTLKTGAEILLGHTMIRRLRLDSLIASRPSRQRDLVTAMIAERLLFPCSKLATTRHWLATTLAEELGVEDATEDEPGRLR